MLKPLIQRLHLTKFFIVIEYFVSFLLLGAATLLCETLASFLLGHNLLMIYLVTVVIAALNLSLQPTLLTVVGGAFIYNYLYVSPRFDFNFEKKEYLATFFAFLIIGSVISSLVKKARDKHLMLEIREAETTSLYDLSRELAAAGDERAIVDAVVTNAERCLATRAAVFLTVDNQLQLAAASSGIAVCQKNRTAVEQALKSGRPAGYGTEKCANSGMFCVPILTSSKEIGVLAINMENMQGLHLERAQRVLESFADQAGIAFERVKLVHEAELAHAMMSRQKLERALLNSVSHDLRTPLATITGVLTSVLDEEDYLSGQMRQELLTTAREEADRLNRFVGKLLDISRLEASNVLLRIEPCDIQELIGCALAAVDLQLRDRQVQVQLDGEIPLVPMDIVLMNQVLVNLLENAIKYSPDGSLISLVGACNADQLVLQVMDQGPGVPDSELEKIFEKFYRIAVPESIKGTGLGLSICHGIIEAHAGSIWASNVAGGGFCITFAIPLQASSQKGA